MGAWGASWACVPWTFRSTSQTSRPMACKLNLPPARTMATTPARRSRSSLPFPAPPPQVCTLPHYCREMVASVAKEPGASPPHAAHGHAGQVAHRCHTSSVTACIQLCRQRLSSSHACPFMHRPFSHRHRHSLHCARVWTCTQGMQPDGEQGEQARQAAQQQGGGCCRRAPHAPHPASCSPPSCCACLPCSPLAP